MQDYPEHHSSASDDSESKSKRGSGLSFIAGIRQFVRRFGLMIVGAAALIALISLVISADGFVRNNELRKEKAKLEEEIEALEDENRILRQKLERLQTDSAYVEDEARKKLRLIRPGETVYRLAEEPDVSDQKPPREPPVIP